MYLKTLFIALSNIYYYFVGLNLSVISYYCFMTSKLLLVLFSLIVLIAYIDMLDSCDKVNYIISTQNRAERAFHLQKTNSFDFVKFFAER